MTARQPLQSALAGLGPDRSVSNGTSRATPSSVAFSTSHFWRSPLGNATPRVIEMTPPRDRPPAARIASSLPPTRRRTSD